MGVAGSLPDTRVGGRHQVHRKIWGLSGRDDYLGSTMKMTSRERALDKIYKRRDRYEIPDWQRTEVWDRTRKQKLIDSILRGWKLPKFYFMKVDGDPEEFEVIDGQQRLMTVFEFFDNELPLSTEATRRFGGPLYEDLKQQFSDAFDDFEIQFDEIEEAEERDLKEFFQRLQGGLPLTASEKLNSVHSKLRDFARSTLAQHAFFKAKVPIADKRYAYFDIASKVAAVEIDGLETSLRFDELKNLYQSQENFSAQSATAKRLRSTFEFLNRAFSVKHPMLKNRTVIQSFATLACRLVATGRASEYEKSFLAFFEHFMTALANQVELGQAATELDYLKFQHSVNANVKTGARTRHEILLRKLFAFDPSVADMFDSAVIAESGIETRAKQLGDEIVALVGRVNSAYSAKHGNDLFKLTNKSSQALARLSKRVADLHAYGAFVDDLYFLVHEGPANRLPKPPQSFADVNDLRTELRHDVDHGKDKKVRAKRRKLASSFSKYAGAASPTTLSPERFPLVQMNILSAVSTDLQAILLTVT